MAETVGFPLFFAFSLLEALPSCRGLQLPPQLPPDLGQYWAGRGAALAKPFDRENRFPVRGSRQRRTAPAAGAEKGNKTMAYHTFTPAQRATIEALVAEMRDNAALWVDVPMGDAVTWSTKAEMIADLAGDWSSDGTFCRPADFIKTLRETVRRTRRPQAEIFAAIRGLGFAVRKVEGGEIRVSRPLRLHASPEARRRAEEQAAYCSDLGEALATAMHWAASLQAEREARAQRLEASKAARAAAVEAGDVAEASRLASAEMREAVEAGEGPRGFLPPLFCPSVSNEALEASASGAEIAQPLDQIAERNRCPEQAPACSAPDLEAEALYREIREAQISDLIKAGREALFCLEGIALLQGNREVLAYASRLGRALSPFAEGAAL